MQDAAVPVPTPRPALSPLLPRASDFITPPPQMDDEETPEVDASHHLQQATPDAALEDSLEHQVQRHAHENLKITQSYTLQTLRLPQ